MNLNYNKTDNIIILLSSSKGAQSRKRITKVLLERPQNCNQIAKQVNLEWWTVQKHLAILTDENILICYSIGKVKYYKVNQIHEKIINIINSENC